MTALPKIDKQKTYKMIFDKRMFSKTHPLEKTEV